MFAITPFTGRRDRNALARRSDMMREIDSFFDNLLWAPDLGGFHYPHGVEIYERDNKLFVEVEAPGVNPDDVELRVARDKLSLKCAKEEKTEEGDKDTTWHVRKNSRCFNFDVDLPVEIDSNKVEASFANGVITISAPKSEPLDSKVVKISSK